MSPVRLFPLLLASLFGASIALQDGQRQPESWCITYLSTYLVPVSDGHTRPTTSSADEAIFSETSELVFTFSTDLAIAPTSPIPDDPVTTTPTPSLTTGASLPTASGRSVIFRVVPESQDSKRDLHVRAVGGFVGSQSEICAAAAIFNLVQGRLLDVGLPIYYNGESFKELRGYPGTLPRGAVTETFADEDGFLRFFSSALPTGEAGFCQDAESGQVYITFTASPPGCQTIRLSITEVDECRDGEISSSPSSRPSSIPLQAQSTSALLETTSSYNAVAPTTTKDIQKGSSAIDSPTFTSQVMPVYTSSVRFSNSSSSIIFQTQPALTQTSSMLDIPTPVTDFLLTSQLSSRASNLETLSTDVLGTSEEPSSILEPTTAATSTTANAIDTIGTSSGTDSTASPVANPSTTSGPSSSFETDTSTTSDLSLDASSSFDSSPTVLATADTRLFTTTTVDTTAVDTTAVDTTTVETITSTTTSSEPTGTRACAEGLAEPLTLFNGQSPSDNGVALVVLPFQIPLYGQSSDVLYISPNGLVTLGDALGADSVPYLAFLPDENIESLAIFPYWIDMIVSEDSGAEVTYQIENIPNQPGVLTVDWCVFSTSDATEPYHFQMVLSEDEVTPITFFYYTIQSGGTLATIGAQNRDADQWVQYYGPIPDRTFMEVDTVGGDIRTGQF